MTYNGIGLRTPRGSGTNGYIQRNLAHISRPRQEFIVGLKTKRNKRNVPKPNKLRVDKSIMEHNQKRQIEVLVYKLQCELEDAGKTEVDVTKLTNEYRQKLLDQIENGINPVSNKSDQHMDDSHQRTAQKMKQNAMMRDALGIQEDDNGELQDEWESQRRARRKEREQEFSEEEKIRYEMDKLSKHPLDHTWPAKYNHHKDKKRKYKHREHDSSEETDSAQSTSEHDSSSSDTSDSDSVSSSDDHRRRKRRRKYRDDHKRRHQRRGNDDDDDDVHDKDISDEEEERYHRRRHRDRDDRERRRREKDTKYRKRSRSRSRSRSRRRSRSRSRSIESDRGRWGDHNRSVSKSKSPVKSNTPKPNDEIVPDF